MAGVNFAALLGNVGRDPEIRQLNSGAPVASFSLATSETWKDRTTGERKERTEWHQVVCFNEGLCKVIEKYVRKGSKLFVKGIIRTRKWQAQDGGDRWTTEIHLSGFDGQLVLVDRASGDRPPPADTPGEGAGPGYGGGSDASQGAAQADDVDDEIPF
jgi:single-strand DNA-binding protein